MPVLTLWQGSRRREIPFEAGVCLGDVLRQHVPGHAHPCGGRGVCGKCQVVLRGQEHPVLSCQTYLTDQDAEVFLPETLSIAQVAMTGESVNAHGAVSSVGTAVDIGTTTVVLALYDLDTGSCLAEKAMLNPQTSIAADVIGRMEAAMKGELALEQQLILSSIDMLEEAACRDAGVNKNLVQSHVITGNTTMLYLLTGRNPVSLSKAPFEVDTLFDQDIPWKNGAAYLPGCMNAFVGADITCAVLESGMCESADTSLLCDLGTNGELALWKDGKLYVTSTAAGPVFEGACISCGVNSIPGAIDRVWTEDGEVCIHAIGQQDPVGLCGSGLMDAIASLLEIEKLDETGALETDPYPLAKGVALTQADIRAVQLAKAAIYAGMVTLLKAAHCRPKNVRKFYVAGGFGSHVSMESAAKIGMIPDLLAKKAEVLGNAALRGAVKLLVMPDARKKAQAIAAASVHVALGGNAGFNDAYIEAMMFPEQE